MIDRLRPSRTIGKELIMTQRVILKTLVGSRAHGLHTEDSDYDYRGVFVEDTKDILSLDYKSHPVSWIEGKEDQTSYEIGHFLSLACRSNPSILEVMIAPIHEAGKYGFKLRELFPLIWNSKDVYNAFTGYSHNQMKKLVDGDKFPRSEKYGVAYLRVLQMAYDLLTTGNMSLKVEDSPLRDCLLAIKNGGLSKGQILDEASHLRRHVDQAYKDNPDKKTDYEAVNQFLLEVRKTYW
jgi:predicted nucleotidyltransferase